jgi:5-carboxyvanillate decarboxylase
MIEGQRVIAVEEHFSTSSYLEVAHALDVWPGDEQEMTLMRSVEATDLMRARLVDFDARLQDMDTNGTDVAVLSLNPPGVQPYKTEAAVALARDFNEGLAEIVKRWPTRFAGLGTVAPQDPQQAALEIERIMGPLGLSGVMVNSHTHGHYLDEPQFEPLLEAAEAHGAPIYLHPRFPSPQMLAPYQNYGMAAAVWGYQAEAGTHAVRLILSGTLDRHPNLKIVLGHLGEGLPFWMRRLDNRYAWAYRAAGESLGMVKLELTPSDYVRRNFALATSGIEDHNVLDLCLRTVGEDNLLYAIDFPYEESASAAAFLRTAELTELQRAKISHLNAETLFRIPSSQLAGSTPDL